MFEKKIEFIATNNEMVDVWPHPKPSTHFVPEEYKKLHRYEKNNFHEPTVKTCIPFLDSLTAGYIIPLPTGSIPFSTFSSKSFTP